MKSKNSKKSLITLLVAVILIIAAVVGIIITENAAKNVSKELSVKESQKIVDDTFKALAKTTATGAKAVIAASEVKVNSVKKGDQKNLLLDCSYKTIDIASEIKANKNELMKKVYNKYIENEAAGISTNATRISIDIAEEISKYIETAKELSGNITLQLFEQEKGNFVLYLEDKVVNTCIGGLLIVADEISGITSVEISGEVIDISKNNTLRTGLTQCLALKNYDTTKITAGTPLSKWWAEFSDEFKRNFIDKAQWKYLTDGLLTTLTISGAAALIGILIGFFVAIIRCTYQTTGKLKILNGIFSVYLTVMRGTPVMVQLLIIYFVFLLPAGVDKLPAAILCFGLNSGAYVAEIVRGGIMSIDRGQIEAGRSLGFNYPSTMYYVVVPQAFKAVLPSLANEFITLLKESSVAFYIGVADLTQAGLKIRSITYSNFMPLVAVALIYLVIVVVLTKLVNILERRLRKSDH